MLLQGSLSIDAMGLCKGTLALGGVEEGTKIFSTAIAESSEIASPQAKRAASLLCVLRRVTSL